jgi:adenine-specific DNA-methyltransferase
MPELHFKGKEYVYNHHLNVPFRPLIAQPDKSIGEDSGNLIIHGDNLHALKALLPRYAGKVDCVFIDPPYNTGEENWMYNDNVNSPIMREWLNNNPVNKEDMLRHDKWACLIYPRLKLLHELLAATGSFWMTIDDNEIHQARMILDEIFGGNNFIACNVWQKRYSRENREAIGDVHDYVLVYAKDPSYFKLTRNKVIPTDDQLAVYRNTNIDGNAPKEPWRPIPITAQEGHATKDQYYEIIAPGGKSHFPSKGRCWGLSEDTFKKLREDGRIYFGQDGNSQPNIIRYQSEVEGFVPWTWWPSTETGHTDEAKKEIYSILGRMVDIFATPKPTRLLHRIIQIATQKDALILDSFAGSATTAHAVLSQNAQDGGSRKFILVECEDYANSLTAERMRRVINGYEFEGTQKEELHREKITWSNFSKEGPHHKIIQHVQSIENIDGLRFDNIKKEIKDGELIVTGENKITEHMPGLGGGFTFYTLGEPLDIDKILTGETLPDYSALGAWLFHTATGQPLNVEQIDAERWYLGSSSQYHVWLIYRPDLDFLKSPQAALTLSVAETIGQTYKDKSHLVFAAAKYAPNRLLLPLGVEYAPLPFALYRIEKD